jgi:Tfp pilus assembly protein PilF
MAVRILLLACAVALIAFGASRGRAHQACQDARVDALQVTLRRAPVSDAAGIATRIADHCRDVEELVNGAAAFARVGATAPAAKLAARAVAQEPDRRNAWLALAAVRQREGDGSGADRARARARALDPVGLSGR